MTPLTRSAKFYLVITAVCHILETTLTISSKENGERTRNVVMGSILYQKRIFNYEVRCITYIRKNSIKHVSKYVSFKMHILQLCN